MNDSPAVEPLRLRRLPMLAAALCFAAGEVAARRWPATFAIVAALALLLALMVLSLRRAPRVALIPAFALWSVAGCWCAEMQPPVPAQTALTQYADGLSRTVRGRVTRVRTLASFNENTSAPQQPSEPWRLEPGVWEPDAQPAAVSIDLDLEAVEDVTPDTSTMRSVRGGVRVTVLASAVAGGAAPACGDILEMPLRLRLPDTYRDPGAWSHAAELLTEGVAAQASVKRERVTHVGHAPPGWRCRIDEAQAWAAARLESFARSVPNTRMPAALRLNATDISMLDAMLLGDRARLDPALRTSFERTGTFHLFVVSGLHIVLLSGAIFWLLRRLRVREGVAVVLTLALATGYALLTGFGVPVERALGMTAVYLVAGWLARDRSPLNALGVAALAVLVCDPRALFEAGFQMTFLIILAIAGLAAPLSQRLFASWRSTVHELSVLRLDAQLAPHIAQRRVLLRMLGDVCADLLVQPARELPVWMLRVVLTVLEALLLCVVAELAMMLPMAVYFHRITLFALPSNLLTVPLIALLMAVSAVFFCALLLNPYAALLPGAATALLLHAVDALIGSFSHARLADVRVPSPAPACVAIACALIAFCCVSLTARRRPWMLSGVVALALLPVAVLWPSPALLHSGLLEVTALDVGQGDSLLVVSPEGRTLLVDAGGPVGRAASTGRWDVGEEVVAPYLWTRRIRRLDAVLLTHAHSDHMGGMPAVLRDLRPRELWLSVQPGKSPGLAALLAEARELGIRIRWFRAGDAFAWGGLSARVLAPEVGYENPNEAVNDDSLVMQLNFGKASALLEGDAEAFSEDAMLAHGRLTPVTLLKVGHHGSNTSTRPEFLAAVAPREAVISVGRHNTFGHPRAEVLERLEAGHVPTFRTDRAGAETFFLRSDGGISAISAASNP